MAVLAVSGEGSMATMRFEGFLGIEQPLHSSSFATLRPSSDRIVTQSPRVLPAPANRMCGPQCPGILQIISWRRHRVDLAYIMASLA